MWNFLLSAPNTNAYIAIGFSPNGNMVGSNAIVGWAGADGISDMKEYFLGGQSPNLVRLESPNQGLPIGNSTMFTQSNQIYIAFQLLTDNPTTRLIYAVGYAGRLPSPAPNFQLSEHRDKISTRFNYASGQCLPQTLSFSFSFFLKKNSFE